MKHAKARMKSPTCHNVSEPKELIVADGFAFTNYEAFHFDRVSNNERTLIEGGNERTKVLKGSFPGVGFP